MYTKALSNREWKLRQGGDQGWTCSSLRMTHRIKESKSRQREQKQKFVANYRNLFSCLFYRILAHEDCVLTVNCAFDMIFKLLINTINEVIYWLGNEAWDFPKMLENMTFGLKMGILSFSMLARLFTQSKWIWNCQLYSHRSLVQVDDLMVTNFGFIMPNLKFWILNFLAMCIWQVIYLSNTLFSLELELK